MLSSFKLRTDAHGMHDITRTVENEVTNSKVKEGLCVIYSPHTTAGITINEAADPDVQRDMLLSLSKAFPDLKEFRHFEGNSSSHVRTSVVGPSQTMIIHDGRLLLGTWQGIYFAEFDGPRNRTFYIKIIEG